MGLQESRGADSSRQLDVYGILAKGCCYDNKDYVNAGKNIMFAKNNLKKLNNSKLYYLAGAVLQ
ncbi:MAG: hypothetical protein U0T81_18500 [Saprospiraceae bacterium]